MKTQQFDVISVRMRKHSTVWRLNGKIHRDSGPAKTESDFEIDSQSWYQFGHLHRWNGPAKISLSHNGVSRVLETRFDEWAIWGVTTLEIRRNFLREK